MSTKNSLEKMRLKQEIEDKKIGTKILGVWSISIMAVALLAGSIPAIQQISPTIEPLTRYVPAIAAWASNSDNYAAASIVYFFMLITLPFVAVKLWGPLSFRRDNNVLQALVLSVALFWFIFEFAIMGRVFGDNALVTDPIISGPGTAKTRMLFGSTAGFGIFTSICGTGTVCISVVLVKAIARIVNIFKREQ